MPRQALRPRRGRRSPAMPDKNLNDDRYLRADLKMVAARGRRFCEPAVIDQRAQQDVTHVNEGRLGESPDTCRVTMQCSVRDKFTGFRRPLALASPEILVGISTSIKY